MVMNFPSKRLIVFRLLAMLLPVLLLVTAEIVLRAFRYGHDTSLFITDPANANSWIMNPYASLPFFANPEQATSGNADAFSKKKATGALRIFVLGESTTIGYPYMHNGAFPRLLKYRMMRERPDLNIEMINLSLTAVNSFTTLNFAKQLIDYSPDAVLLYVGHNEYYGAMGAGSDQVLGQYPAWQKMILSLRRLRLWQWLSSVYYWVGSRQATAADSETLMSTMAAGQLVVKGSPIYQQGILRYSHNLNALCDLLKDNGVPVFIGNLVSNIRSMQPLGSTDSAKEAWENYRAGNLAMKNGDTAVARKKFLLAKELDPLRFRAPEAMNRVIEKACTNRSGIYLVDLHSAFEKKSAGGMIGDELLLEHVHPNIDGYALMANSYYQSLISAKLFQPLPDRILAEAALLQDLPVTRVDSLKGAYEIAALRSGWPFFEQVAQMPVRDVEERLAYRLLTKAISWNQAMDTLLPLYLSRRDIQNACKVAEGALLEHPGEPVFYETAGDCSKALGDSLRYQQYLASAFRLLPTVNRARKSIDACLMNDDPETAMTYLKYLLQQSPQHKPYQVLQTTLQELLALKERGRDADEKVATVYQKLGYPKIAKKYAGSF